MSTSWDLIAKRGQYYTLLDNTKDVLNSITRARDIMLNHKTDAESNYKIDDDGADDGFYNEKIVELNSLINSLNNIIIPSINSKIYNLGQDIERAQEKEEAERNAESE